MSKKTAEPVHEIWGILHTPENCFVQFGTKAAWNGSGPAIRAFQVHNDYKKFQDFPDFQVVNLTEAFYRLQQLGEQG